MEPNPANSDRGCSAPEGLRIVRATPDDADTLVQLVAELAAFEKLSAECRITEDAVLQHLIGPHRCAEALLAWLEDAPVGFAVYYRTFSTFTARPGLFLEDLYVRERFRRRGIGQALFKDVARLARASGSGRFEWTALNWNAPARKFYTGAGARELTEWGLFRMDAPAIAAFAGPCGGHPGHPSAGCSCGGKGPHHGKATPNSGCGCR